MTFHKEDNKCIKDSKDNVKVLCIARLRDVFYSINCFPCVKKILIMC